MCKECGNTYKIEEERIICAVCGYELEEKDAFYFDGSYYCEECLDDITVLCDRCGERIREEDAERDSNYSLCCDCYNDYYYRCERCGAIIRNDDAYFIDEYDDYPYCYTCYQHECNDKSIHDYGYKPEPVFYGDGERYFGIELEVDEGGKDNNNAENVLYLANKEADNIYIKSDGSLSDGMEIVSHPMTLDYHKNRMPWEKIMKRLVRMGYKSHNTSTCGLHCHINKNSFGRGIDEQEAAIARVIYFVEQHWEELLKFSRRTEEQMRRWAARYGAKNNPSEFLKDIKSRRMGYNRYTCINLQNANTIEFRLFRGTLKYNTFIATLQLVNEICNVAVFMSDEIMSALSWNEFVSSLNNENYSELITYLKERNLYINEPIESEDEEECAVYLD